MNLRDFPYAFHGQYRAPDYDKKEKRFFKSVASGFCGFPDKLNR